MQVQVQVSSAPAARRAAVAEVVVAVGASLAANFVPHQAPHVADDARLLLAAQLMLVKVVVEVVVVEYLLYAESLPDVDCDTLGHGQACFHPSWTPSGTA